MFTSLAKFIPRVSFLFFGWWGAIMSESLEGSFSDPENFC
jgi:hypothetical protein